MILQSEIVPTMMVAASIIAGAPFPFLVYLSIRIQIPDDLVVPRAVDLDELKVRVSLDRQGFVRDVHVNAWIECLD